MDGLKEANYFPQLSLEFCFRAQRFEGQKSRIIGIKSASLAPGLRLCANF
jgi:hypothetical protein